MCVPFRASRTLPGGGFSPPSDVWSASFRLRERWEAQSHPFLTRLGHSVLWDLLPGDAGRASAHTHHAEDPSLSPRMKLVCLLAELLPVPPSPPPPLLSWLLPRLLRSPRAAAQSDPQFVISRRTELWTPCPRRCCLCPHLQQVLDCPNMLAAASSAFALRCFIVSFLCFLLILSLSVCRSVGVGGRLGGGGGGGCFHDLRDDSPGLTAVAAMAAF